jgi:hypothetical protein
MTYRAFESHSCCRLKDGFLVEVGGSYWVNICADRVRNYKGPIVVDSIEAVVFDGDYTFSIGVKKSIGGFCFVTFDEITVICEI